MGFGVRTPWLRVSAMLLALAGGASLASAQNVSPRTAPRDTVPADTVPGDTLRPEVRPNPRADSILSALRELEGYTVTEYQGETAEYRTENRVLRLEGSAEVLRDGSRLTADTILYRDQVQLVEAYGSPSVSGQAQELKGNVLYYDLANRRATALGARTQFSQGANWFVTGDVSLEGTNRVYATHGQFTSCELDTPHYHFESDKIVVVKDQLLVARPARLYFGKVPVMWLPFVVQNLEKGRRSGLLAPRFGINDIVRTSDGRNGGTGRQISNVGWYWAINDYMGAQTSVDWRSGEYTALQGTLDYRWRRQFLNGQLSLQRFWTDQGRELTFRGNTSWQPSERTSLNMQGSYASRSSFVRRQSTDPREVTQDLTSTFSLNRRFDWGRLSLGADRRQSIADGDVSMTLPSFSLSLQPITLFQAPTPEQERWYSNASFAPGAVTGRRTVRDDSDNLSTRRQDQTRTSLQVSPSFSVGNFTLNSGASIDRTLLEEVVGVDSTAAEVALGGFAQDEADWSLSASYRQQLIGSTSISPNIGLRQEIQRDTLTNDEYLGAPVRLNFGTGLNTDLYGFYPGVFALSAIRHRISPRINYSYAPAVNQTALQDSVFGVNSALTQNRVSLSINQTWEAKLEPSRVEVPADTSADSTGVVQNAPTEPRKVTLLSINTSPIVYDFADTTGVGWVTQRLSNSISSDYLKGLTIRVAHDLFDRTSAGAGELGTFSPRLSSLSTSFELGPTTPIFRWLGFGGHSEDPPVQGVVPGTPDRDDVVPDGQGPFTGNPQGVGSGPWRIALDYSYTRGSRSRTREGETIDPDAVQTLRANMSFPLTPNWALNWSTSYSITDGEFSGHRMNFKRDLHRWQANFDFTRTPNGNSMFEFYVELTDNRDLKFDYRERNIGG